MYIEHRKRVSNIELVISITIENDNRIESGQSELQPIQGYMNKSRAADLYNYYISLFTRFHTEKLKELILQISSSFATSVKFAGQKWSSA